MASDATRTSQPPVVDRVETAAGTVCLSYLGADCARVASGHDVGWLRLDGVPLYATAMFRRADDGTWTIDGRMSAVTAVRDDKAAGHAPAPVRDAAWAFLERTFTIWREARPDIAARAALADRLMEEAKAEERLRTLQAAVERARGEIPALRRARAAAEADLARIEAAMSPPGPTP